MSTQPSSSSPLQPSSLPDFKQWYVLRDLKRANARRFNWQELRDSGFEVFTPLRQIVSHQGNKRIRKEVPIVNDLLFVHSSKSILDPIIEKTPTLQYRYLKKQYMKPMTVNESDMRRFLKVTEDAEKVRYYTPGEIPVSMVGKPARVIGGPLNGYEGKILSIRGSKIRRLLVELPGLISAAVEVNPEFIEILEK